MSPRTSTKRPSRYRYSTSETAVEEEKAKSLPERAYPILAKCQLTNHHQEQCQPDSAVRTSNNHVNMQPEPAIATTGAKRYPIRTFNINQSPRPWYDAEPLTMGDIYTAQEPEHTGGLLDGDDTYQIRDRKETTSPMRRREGGQQKVPMRQPFDTTARATTIYTGSEQGGHYYRTPNERDWETLFFSLRKDFDDYKDMNTALHQQKDAQIATLQQQFRDSEQTDDSEDQYTTTKTGTHVLDPIHRAKRIAEIQRELEKSKHTLNKNSKRKAAAPVDNPRKTHATSLEESLKEARRATEMIARRAEKEKQINDLESRLATLEARVSRHGRHLFNGRKRLESLDRKLRAKEEADTRLVECQLAEQEKPQSANTNGRADARLGAGEEAWLLRNISFNLVKAGPNGH